MKNMQKKNNRQAKNSQNRGFVWPYKAPWRGRSAPSDDHRLGLKGVRLSNRTKIGHVAVLNCLKYSAVDWPGGEVNVMFWHNQHDTTRHVVNTTYRRKITKVFHSHLPALATSLDTITTTTVEKSQKSFTRRKIT